VRRALATFGLVAALALTPALVRSAVADEAEATAPAVQDPTQDQAVEGEHGEEAAEGESEHEHEKPTFNLTKLKGKTADGAPQPGFLFALINFSILMAVLGFLAVPKLKVFIRSRSTRMAKDLDEAAKMKAEAEAKLKEYEAKLARLEDDIAKLTADIRAEAEAEKARIVAAAEANAARAMADAEKAIAGEMARVRAHLEGTAVNAAIEAATKVIRERIVDADQKALADRFIQTLASSRSGKSGVA
jgi:F-type H+-transporting ATPase subunit b